MNDKINSIKKEIEDIFADIQNIRDEYENKIKGRKLKNLIKKDLEKRNNEYNEILNDLSKPSSESEFNHKVFKLELFKRDLEFIKGEIKRKLINQIDSEQKDRVWKEQCKIDDLELYELIELKHSKKYKYVEESYIDDRIVEEIECIDDIEELTFCKKLMEKYDYDTKVIKKRIKEVKKEFREFDRNVLKPMEQYCNNLLDRLDMESVNQLKDYMDKNGDNTEWIDDYKKDRMKREFKEKVKYNTLKKAMIFNSIVDAFSNNSKTNEDLSFLSPFEQESVEKGEFNLWDFEEEEMDEESYHYEDD